MASNNSQPCLREYDFALVVSGVVDLNDDVMDALHEAGCDDATVTLRYGLLFIEFSRSAESLEKALISAILNVRQADIGAEVIRVNECDLVSAADIARRINRSRQLISQYIKGERGPGGFPPPYCFLAEDKPLWAWCAVSYWLAENQLIRPEESRDADVVEAINNFLEQQRQRRRHPDLVAQVERDLIAAGTLGAAHEPTCDRG